MRTPVHFNRPLSIHFRGTFCSMIGGYDRSCYTGGLNSDMCFAVQWGELLNHDIGHLRRLKYWRCENV